MKIAVAVMLALASLGCRAAASTPKPILSALVVHKGKGVDTLVSTFTCTAPTPDTGCGITSSAFSGVVPVGASQELRVVCAAPGTFVTLNLSVVGIAPGVSNSASVSASVSGTCPLPAAVAPTFVLTPFLVKSGGP